MRFWLADAERILKQDGLEKFLNIKIPQPNKSPPDAFKWMLTSRDIQGWLWKGLPKEITDRVVSRMYHIGFADELVYSLQHEVNIIGFNAAFYNCDAFLSLQISDYSSSTEYVAALRNGWAAVAQPSSLLSWSL